MANKDQDKNILVDKEAQRAKLKELIKSIVREMTATGAVGGGAGPISTPHAFGKAKNPTIGTDFKVVDEKKSEKPAEKAPEKQAPAAKPAQYVPIVKKPDDLTTIKKALKLAASRVSAIEKSKQKPQAPAADSTAK
jgi:hypothetical protein